ncbi:glutathione S-transferase family protein [Sorangium sp. So ce1078]|uniref:glutathione S-transferase family protein n=1 Tax=Sorangium sp. So ce1078 TaxID=3133329 RepID=UPI003F62A6C6
MEPVLFYGVPHGCSFGSIVALEWLGQPYRLCRIDLLSTAEDRLFARVNPQHKTPALLLEDGEVLTESSAILNHVAARDLGRGLTFRQGTREFDRVNKALGFLNSGLFSAFLPAWAAYHLDDGRPEKSALRAHARANIAKRYAHIESMLAGREWLAGDGPTVADAYFIGVARWGEDLALFDIQREYPRLHEHMRKLEADRAVVFAHAIEEGRPAESSGKFLGHVSLQELIGRLAPQGRERAVAL